MAHLSGHGEERSVHYGAPGLALTGFRGKNGPWYFWEWGRKCPRGEVIDWLGGSRGKIYGANYWLLRTARLRSAQVRRCPCFDTHIIGMYC